LCFSCWQSAFWTPQYLRYVHTRGGLQLLVIVYLGVGTVGLAILRGLMARSGGAPGGYRSRPMEHPKLFALLNEVAERVQARPIQEVYITPGVSIGVTEEAALYLPPGLGKRILVLGMGALNFLTLDQLRAYSLTNTVTSRIVISSSGALSIVFT
jgi:hypothetical protein